MGSTTTLLSLPTEMLGAVAEHAEPQDLLALRLVCKEVSAATFDVFAKTFFTKRRHLYSYYSLQTLVDITAHPQLVKKVQEVELVCAVIDREHFEHKTLIHYLQPPTNFSVGQEIPKLEQRGTEVLEKWEVEKQKLHANDTVLLGRALDNLRKAGVTAGMTVLLSDLCSNSFGFGTLRRMLGPFVNEDDFHKDRSLVGSHELVFSLLTAIVVMEYPIRHLTLGNGLTRSSFEIRDRLIHTKAAAAFANLQSLTLGFDTRTDVLRTGDNDHNALGKLFRSATALKSLSISATYFEDHVSLLKVLSRGFAAATSLKALKLAHLSAPVHSYIAFLQGCKNSLTTLQLAHAEVPDDECWSTLFLWLAQNAKLEHLGLHQLWKGETLLVREGEELDGGFDGVVAVKEVLESLAEAREYSVEQSDSDGESDEMINDDELADMLDFDSDESAGMDVFL